MHPLFIFSDKGVSILKLKDKAIGLIAILIFVWLVNTFEPVNQENSLMSYLHYFSEEQEKSSNQMVEGAVSGFEGTYVGEHEIDGSNWSIPNILRHYFGR